VGGLLGTVEDGRSGFLVPAGEVHTLADRLRRVLDDPACAERLGVAARATVVERFSWPRAVEATVAVYREVCARA
jgi:type III pantothenate kinase